MELIIAIVIVVAFVAVWYNRRSPEGKIEFVAETTSDNGIIFVAPAAPAPIVAEGAGVIETAPVEKAKKPRAKKPAVVAKTATVKKTATTKKAPAKKPAK